MKINQQHNKLGTIIIIFKKNGNIYIYIYVTYVSTFNPKNPELFGAILQNLNILHEDQNMNAILQANTIIKSKRQPANLKRLLTRAKFDENIQIATINKCNRPNCGLCKCMIVGNSFTFKCGK